MEKFPNWSAQSSTLGVAGLEIVKPERDLKDDPAASDDAGLWARVEIAVTGSACAWLEFTLIFKSDAFPRFLMPESVVTFPTSTPAQRAVWGKRGVSRATMFPTSEVCVEQRTAGSQSSRTPREGRGVWVLTAYGISGLALFGILVYYVSTYVTN